METRAPLKAVRVSPRKARLVARNVVGCPAERALDILQFTPQKAAGIIRQVMYSALSNASNVPGIDADSLRDGMTGVKNAETDSPQNCI